MLGDRFTVGWHPNPTFCFPMKFIFYAERVQKRTHQSSQIAKTLR